MIKKEGKVKVKTRQINMVQRRIIEDTFTESGVFKMLEQDTTQFAHLNLCARVCVRAYTSQYTCVRICSCVLVSVYMCLRIMCTIVQHCICRCTCVYRERKGNTGKVGSMTTITSKGKKEKVNMKKTSASLSSLTCVQRQ